MKKAFKLLSCALLIMSMLAVMVWPAFAAWPEDSTAYVWTTKEVQADSDIYKVTVHLQANYPVTIGDLRVYWPKADWKLIRNTGAKDSSVTTRNALNYLGALADTEEYDTTDYEDGYVLGPGEMDLTVIINVAAKYFNDAVPQDTYSAIQLAWILGNENHYFYDSSRWGNEVYEFYVQKTSDTAKIDDVDVRADAPLGDTACWTGGDVNDSFPAAEWYQTAGHPTLFSTILFEDPTATDGPVLEQAKRQLKFTATSETTVEDAFQFRVVSKISDADWKANFAATGTSDTSKNAITELGFVAYKGTDGFSLDAAKEAAQTGADSGEYYVATTNYIQHSDGSDAQFAATIKFSSAHSDVTYLAYVKYNDAEGTEQYLFYEEEKEALLKTDHENLVEQYLKAFPYAG